MRSLQCLVWSSLMISVAHAQSPGDTTAPPPPPPPQPTAAAGICVTIDPARDTLTEQERVAARGLVLQAFDAEKLPTDSSGTNCRETYSVSNIKLGNTINVTITG